MNRFGELSGGHIRVQCLLQAVYLIDRRLGPSVCKTSWLDRHSLVIWEPTPRQLATNFPRRDKTSLGEKCLLSAFVLVFGANRNQGAAPRLEDFPLSLDSPSVHPGEIQLPFAAGHKWSPGSGTRLSQGIVRSAKPSIRLSEVLSPTQQ